MRTKVLFIYKYGTFVEEIPINYTLDKVIFYTGAISHIVRIATELYYEIVLITNLVYLGTESFPRVLFNASHKLMLKTIEGEGIHLSSVYIATVQILSNTVIGIPYSSFSKTYDRSQSIVVGDNIILRTKTVGNQYLYFKIKKLNGGITAQQTFSWKRIYKMLKFCFSECAYRRSSKETDIQIFIQIDGKGISYINTGFGFIDHMMDQICIHANIDLVFKVKGDLNVGEHHTIEDTAIAIGYAFSRSLKDKRGIARYGFLLPMDDALVQVALDLGGRSHFVWKASFEREKIGDIPTEMFAHFFKSFSDVAYCNLYINAEGNNEHHKIEAIFKAFSCALQMATSRNHNNDRLPSTKEIL